MEKTISSYTPVDLTNWKRKEHFDAFQSIAQCSFSQTVQLDITRLLKHVKAQDWKFYPTIVHLITRLLNKHPEFRMAMKDNTLVTWDVIHPCFTTFHKETETFSSLWCYYDESPERFLKAFSDEIARYDNNLAYFPQGELIENLFFISANPWVSFTSFNLNVANINNFFAPTFTIGKYYMSGEKILMPLAIQVHHAVCDGYHAGRLINELQEACNEF